MKLELVSETFIRGLFKINVFKNSRGLWTFDYKTLGRGSWVSTNLEVATRKAAIDAAPFYLGEVAS